MNTSRLIVVIFTASQLVGCATVSRGGNCRVLVVTSPVTAVAQVENAVEAAIAAAVYTAAVFLNGGIILIGRGR